MKTKIIPYLLTLPFLFLYRLKTGNFRYIAEALSLVPMPVGKKMRYEFYRRTLAGCGENVVFQIGTTLRFDDVKIGNNVYFEKFAQVAMADVGDDSLIGSYSIIISGKRPHNFDDRDTPIRLQKGSRKKITIGRDVWIGVGAIVMESVGDGSVVGAGSVVTKPIPPYSVAVGNPAVVIRKRGEKAPEKKGENAD